jgi:trehalose-6-phosphate synthase
LINLNFQNKIKLRKSFFIMFDITGPVTPPGGEKPKKAKSVPKKELKKPNNKKPNQPTEEFLGMKVTKEQKKKIYANLCNQIINQIKHDSARQKKAMENLRRSELGQPPLP